MDILAAQIKGVLDEIPIEFGGGCSLSKGYVMAWLIRRFNMQATIDIGVYIGRSLFPQVIAHRDYTGGVAYGVDPWSASEAVEHDNPALKERIVEFALTTDWQKLYDGVAAVREQIGGEKHCVLVRATSEEALPRFQESQTKFDLIHVDGNHDTCHVMGDLDMYVPLLKDEGFILIDDISWDSVKPAYDRLRLEMSLVYQSRVNGNDYAVFWNGRDNRQAMDLRNHLQPAAESLGQGGRKWKRGLRGRLSNLAYRFKKPKTEGKLVILDEIFPNLLSPFRIAEYNEYLDHFQGAEVHSKGMHFNGVGNLDEYVNEYSEYYPGRRERISKLNPFTRIAGNAGYTVFISNAFEFLPILEHSQLPFAFTLYPGGGFNLNDETSDQRLRRVCSSKFFRKVITTQKISGDYLIKKGFCDPKKIEFVYGGVFPSNQLAQRAVPRVRYGEGKSTFDICFVSHRYTDTGIDKGYDVFLDVARKLAAAHSDVMFHVVGDYDETVLDVSGLESRLTFHGMMRTDEFPAFHSRMDLILSPNVPFVLHPGGFDGFPTGCCMEAAFCGVPVFCTDELSLNIAFKDREDIVLVPHDVDGICSIIEHYYADPAELYALGERGRESFMRVFDIKLQIAPRIKLLEQLLAVGR